MGLTIAHALKNRYPSAKIAILEKEQSIGMHASGRNSGVLHSGIYYPQDSLKASVCAEGARRMMHFAQQHHIPCKQSGKVIIATCQEELHALDLLLANARRNNIDAQYLTAKEIKAIEPHASPFQYGIYTNATATIDGRQVLATLTAIIEAQGVALHLGQNAVAVDRDKQLITTASHTTASHTTFQFNYLINCAGAGTDRIAKLFGLAKDYVLLPFKGIYYKLTPDKSFLVNGNIYPVPDLKLPFLGVHFSRNIHGDVYVGPTAMPAFGRENYGMFTGLSFEAVRIIKDILHMYLANQQNFRMLMHTEMKRYLKFYFMRGARKLVANIQSTDLLTSNKVGIRPQLIDTTKRKIVMDYIIEQEAHSMHILNAISPAFTSAFAFADLIVNKI